MTFELWFKEKYPDIYRSLADGTAAPNERWLMDIALNAFKGGYQTGYLQGVADNEASHVQAAGTDSPRP